MSKLPKTVPKNPSNKSYLYSNNETALPSQKKCKSLRISNHLYFNKDGKTYAFPVYKDSDIGIDPENSGCVIDLKIDQDCESTNSVIKYGMKLCEEDLRDGVRHKNEEDWDDDWD